MKRDTKKEKDIEDIKCGDVFVRETRGRYYTKIQGERKTDVDQRNKTER